MKKAAVPILIIATGIGWMLSSNNVLPGVNWAFVLLMAVAGILAMINQLTKVSIVLGPMLMIGSVVLVMLQTEKIKIEMGLPIMVITFGILMLIARFSSLPDGMMTASDDEKSKEDGENTAEKPTDS